MPRRRVMPLNRFYKLRINEVVGESSGLAICFDDGSVLHARAGHIFQSGSWVRINSRDRNLRLFTRVMVAKAALDRCALNIYFKNGNSLRIKDGFLVAGSFTFDVTGGRKLTERETYLPDGV